jgi:hypothetical protein
VHVTWRVLPAMHHPVMAALALHHLPPASDLHIRKRQPKHLASAAAPFW